MNSGGIPKAFFFFYTEKSRALNVCLKNEGSYHTEDQRYGLGPTPSQAVREDRGNIKQETLKDV